MTQHQHDGLGPDGLAGSRALVTGGGRGIGAAIARALAEAGATVTVTGRDRARLDAVVAEIEGRGGRAQAEVMDVTDEAVVRQVIGGGGGAGDHDQVLAPGAGDEAGSPTAVSGVFDILVNNAGVADSVPFKRMDRAHWERMLAVNLTGVYLCCRAALPGMLARGGGRVVNIASTAGLRGYAYVAAYAAAKHGVIGLTRSLALECARAGVTVNAVCPGYTDTDMTRATLANIQAKTGRSAEDALAALVSDNPQRRLIQPEEVASAVLWLCSPGAAAVTGQAIAVAGGEVM
ncbi:SDR family NAD(P)-dependent oxidoreductase [Haliangium sp.]